MTNSIPVHSSLISDGKVAAWEAAYECRESSRVDWALSELEAYAADAELEPLAYELVA